MTLEINSFKIQKAPATAFYIPNFVNGDEEKLLLNKIYNVPKPKWTQLSNRRLQNWGGVPHSKGMLVEQIPQWLSLYLDKVYELGVFSEKCKPNHILINEYLPGQGIMPHFDGPIFYPTIATLSLGSHTVLNFYLPQDDGKVLIEEKIFSLFVEPRSLLILKNDMYSKYLHGIDEKICDILPSPEVLNYYASDLLSESYEDKQLEEQVSLSSLKETSNVLLMSTECEDVNSETIIAKNDPINKREAACQNNQLLERGTRVSLTMRHVPKTSKVKLKLGK